MIPWVITRIASIVVRFVSFYFVASGSCCYDVTFVHKSDVVLEIYGCPALDGLLCITMISSSG